MSDNAQSFTRKMPASACLGVQHHLSGDRRRAGYGRLAADADGPTTAEAFGSEGSDAGEETGTGAILIELAAGVWVVGAGAFDAFLLHAARAATITSPGTHRRARSRRR